MWHWGGQRRLHVASRLQHTCHWRWFYVITHSRLLLTADHSLPAIALKLAASPPPVAADDSERPQQTRTHRNHHRTG